MPFLIPQLSFIIQSLKHPDVFCLADYKGNTVATDTLKSAPNDDDREIATWYGFFNLGLWFDKLIR